MIFGLTMFGFILAIVALAAVARTRVRKDREAAAAASEAEQAQVIHAEAAFRRARLATAAGRRSILAEQGK